MTFCQHGLLRQWLNDNVWQCVFVCLKLSHMQHFIFLKLIVRALTFCQHGIVQQCFNQSVSLSSLWACDWALGHTMNHTKQHRHKPHIACEALCGECPAIWISSARSWGFPTLQLMSSAFAAQPTEATCPGTTFGRLQHGGRQYFLQLTCFEYQTASCQRFNHTTCGWCSGCLVLFAFWHCNGWPHCNPHGAKANEGTNSLTH